MAARKLKRAASKRDRVRRASPRLVTGQRVRVDSGIWAGELGTVQKLGGAMPLVQLDCKNVAQPIEAERLVAL